MPGLSGLSGLSGASAIFGGVAAVPVGQYDDVLYMVHAYEPARCLLTAYNGQPIVRLRRVSDDAEANFTNVSLGDQELNKAAIEAWAGGSAFYEVTKSDQVGGDDITQAVAASQPLFDLAVKNGHAGAVYDGLDDYQQGPYTTGGALSQPFNAYAVAQLDATAVNDDNNHSLIDGDDGTNRNSLYQHPAGTPDDWGWYTGIELSSAVATDAGWNLFAALANGASSELWKNSASIAAGNAGTMSPDGLTVGAKHNGTNFWKGFVCSVVVVDPAHSDAQRQALEAIQNAYWACY